jgi:hypothetical protein
MKDKISRRQAVAINISLANRVDSCMVGGFL